MKSWLFLFIFCGLTIKGCFSNAVKKDSFPWMAFLYYHDSAVKNHLYEHKRFLQNAILIKPEFLLTTSIIEPEMINNKLPNGFPHKTLLARIGAITVDESLQYNEDENEQEREIVQVIRPYHYNHHLWWKSDISVLKSVTPFNVKFITFPILYGTVEHDCLNLVFVKNNVTMERQLMKYDFRILPKSQCGNDFYEATMICGDYSDDSPPPDFCEGNSGGPLMCTDRLIGLQSFINDECKSPYLFQSLVKWQKFITCSISQTCHEEECSTTCSVTYKDLAENSKENQVIPKGEEMNETLNVIPADATESLSDEAEVTRTSAPTKPNFKSTTFLPTIIITDDGLRNTIDSSEITEKSKENEDGSGDLHNTIDNSEITEKSKENEDGSGDLRNTIDSSEITEKSKENEDGSGDLESMAITSKGLEVGEKDDSSENKNDSANSLSLEVSKLNEIEESALVKEDIKNDDIVEKSNKNVIKLEEKIEDLSDEKTRENTVKIEESDESAEVDKTEDGSSPTYSLVTKGLTKISLQNQDVNFSLTTSKIVQTPTTSAAVPTPLSADKALRTSGKSGTDSASHEKLSEEKSGESKGDRRLDVNGDVSHESGSSVTEVASQEASREVSAERRFDGSGASVISVESATSGEIVAEKNSEEKSGEKNTESARKSADRVDLTGDITAESSGDKSDEKLARRDNSESVEDVETRRRVVSGKLFPPTVSDEVSTTTITTDATNVTEQFRARDEKPELRGYSHGTKTSYGTGLIASVCFRYLYCFYF